MTFRNELVRNGPILEYGIQVDPRLIHHHDVIISTRAYTQDESDKPLVRGALERTREYGYPALIATCIAMDPRARLFVSRSDGPSNLSELVRGQGATIEGISIPNDRGGRDTVVSGALSESQFDQTTSHEMCHGVVDSMRNLGYINDDFLLLMLEQAVEAVQPEAIEQLKVNRPDLDPQEVDRWAGILKTEIDDATDLSKYPNIMDQAEEFLCDSIDNYCYPMARVILEGAYRTMDTQIRPVIEQYLLNNLEYQLTQDRATYPLIYINPSVMNSCTIDRARASSIHREQVRISNILQQGLQIQHHSIGSLASTRGYWRRRERSNYQYKHDKQQNFGLDKTA